MSMTGNLKSISPKLLDILKKDPSITGHIAMASNPLMQIFDPAMTGQLPPDTAALFNQSMDSIKELGRGMIEEIKKKHPDEFEDVSKEIETPALSLQKEWHALHYLLTGTVWEAKGTIGQTLLGGQEIGEDLGYGPVRYLTPEEVQDVNEALSGITEADIKANFDPQKMTAMEIYPGHWEEDYIEFLLNTFKAVVHYYMEAAENKKVMLLYIA